MKNLNRVWTMGLLVVLAAGAQAQPGRKPSKPDPAPLPTPGPTTPPAPIPDPKVPAPPTTPEPATPTSPTPTPTPSPTTPKPAPKSLEPTGPATRGMIDLRPKFKVGQEFRLKMGNTSESTTSMPGLFEDPDGKPLPGGPNTPSPNGKPGGEEDNKSKTTQEFVLVFRPTAVSEEGEATVEVVFESIKMKIESDWMTDEFDSTKPKPTTPAPKKSADPLSEFANTPPLEQSLRPLVGDVLTLTVDKNGNVTKVEGGEKFAALFGEAGGGVPGGPAGSGGGGAKGLFGGIFTVDKTRPTARVGDTWTTRDTIDLSMTGPLEMSTTYSVREARGGKATIGIKGMMQTGTAARPGVPFKINSVTHEGSYVWNTDDGFVESITSTQNLDAELKIGAGKAGKATAVQKTTVTRVR